MPHKIWRPMVGGERHTVVARWSPWTLEGELVLDGAIIQTWGTRLAGPDIKFQIEEHPAFLRNTLTDFDLFVDNQKILHNK
jgi:hypothetical protein